MLAFLKKIFASTNYKQLVLNGAIIIDVRTGAEYDAGHIAQSKNIPVDRVSIKLAEIKSYNQPIICCCASGMRSGVAAQKLKANGIIAYNGGSWVSLLNKIK
jgi:rhodanese-related sulfurtransferase